MPAAEQQGLTESFVLTGLGMAVPEAGPSFATPIGNVAGRPEIYQPLLAMIDEGPLSIRTARQSPGFAARPLVELMQAFALLVSGGYAHPMLPEGGTAAGRDAARRLNQAIAQANADAADLPRLAAPAIGSAVGVDMLETMVVGELLAGRTADVDPLAAEVLAVLARSGRNVQRDGKPVTDPVEVASDRRGCHPDHDREALPGAATVRRAGGVKRWGRSRGVGSELDNAEARHRR